MIKDSYTIEGRTKILELERFLTEVLAFGRKLVLTFRFYASHSPAADSPYRKLCDEFTRDKRAGVSNISDQIQVYVVPPELKNELSLLRHLECGPDDNRSLFGIVVSREQGPAEFVHSELEFVDEMDLPSPESIPRSLSSVSAFPPVKALPTFVQNRPLIIPSRIIPQSMATPFVPQPVVQVQPMISQFDLEAIKKVAQFCAQNGVQTIQTFKEKPNASISMPFLFEGRPGNAEFLQILKQLIYSPATSTSSSSSFGSGPVSRPVAGMPFPTNNFGRPPNAGGGAAGFPRFGPR